MPARLDTPASISHHSSHPLRRPPFASRIQAGVAALLATALLSVALPPTAAAVDIANIGTPGTPGVSGLFPTAGGSGGNSSAAAVSGDIENTVSAAAGAGGVGGSGPLGANGGRGGGANAALNVTNVVLQPGEYTVLRQQVTATGGAGGNGGNGLLRGNGGAGGAATASGRQDGTADLDTELRGQIDNFFTVTATGGAGGTGLTGGAGGSARGIADSTAVFRSGDAIATTTARGGDGGIGILRGGAGGNASATASSDGGFPVYQRAEATAIGGNGGSAPHGLNGNGGNATAAADGDYGARALGMDVVARATGGNSGTGTAAGGRGGDARAFAHSVTSYVGDASPQAFAQGGAGAVRGGDAVARADSLAVYMGAHAGAHAIAGTGPQAGAALATATATNSWIFNESSALAESAGPLVHKASAVVSTFAYETGTADSQTFAQATIGDVQHLQPTPVPEQASVAARAIGAPSAQMTAAALAGNTAIATALDGGRVWALGAIGTGDHVFDRLDASLSYTFDLADANGEDLWLGLLDSSLPADSNGNFHFAVSGEGTTLFERDFVGNEFLDFFDDRAFNLGDLSSLVGADRLLDIDVSFSGYVDDIGFLIGQSRATTSSVPEPMSLGLLLAGLAGLGLIRFAKRPPLAPRIQAGAAALLLTALIQNADAVDIVRTGNPGTPGVSGPTPTTGGNGGYSSAAAVSGDITNSVSATGGAGGVGGSGPLGANGGRGGGGNAALNTRNVKLDPTQLLEELHQQVTATGGAGGNGGAGLLAGNGGTGGAATAVGRQDGTADLDFELRNAVANFLTVNATGGAGGTGLLGGGGGNARSVAEPVPVQPSAGTFVSSNAHGGDGGYGVLFGGAGGNASASAKTDASSNPTDNRVEAIATGGNGGGATLGLNGNGGNATAVVDGTYFSRGLGLDVVARATGGDSGTGPAAGGRGGNAFAIAHGLAGSIGTADPQAFAQGGAGAVRGGDAVAQANGVAELLGSYASAHAIAGTGPQAGAALATATSANQWIINNASATAESSGPLVRRVTVASGSFANETGSAEQYSFAQASVGDVRHLHPEAPPEHATASVRGAGAPSAQATAAVLANNTAIATALNGGKVWATGEIGTGDHVFDFLNTFLSYTFDLNDANGEDLWLGLLDSSLPADSNGNFHFAVSGEGTTLFERDFVGNEFLDFFDDRAFNLGDLSALVGADRLLDIDVSFSGYVDDIGFLIGQGRADTSSVPEPMPLGLLVSGLAGLGLMRLRGVRRTHA